MDLKRKRQEAYTFQKRYKEEDDENDLVKVENEFFDIFNNFPYFDIIEKYRIPENRTNFGYKYRDDEIRYEEIPQIEIIFRSKLINITIDANKKVFNIKKYQITFEANEVIIEYKSMINSIMIRFINGQIYDVRIRSQYKGRLELNSEDIDYIYTFFNLFYRELIKESNFF